MPAFDPTCIDVEDFLDCLEVRNVVSATEKEFKFSCPYPAHAKGDESPSCYMNKATTAFMCHSCHAHGNAVSFTADILQVSPLAATRLLKERYSPQGIDPDSRCRVEELQKMRANRIKSPKKEMSVYSDDLLKNFEVDWIWHFAEYKQGFGSAWAHYMFDRGFTMPMLHKWQFGYSHERNRITLPVYDEEMRLVGIKARAWQPNTKQKYLNLKDERLGLEPYLKNDVVFGLGQARLHGGNDYIIVEGEYNVVFMTHYGYVNTIALNGSYFGERQIALIKRYASSVTLFFDSDRAGKDATEAVAEELGPFMPVFICPDHYGDPAEMHARSISDCLAEKVSLTRRRLLANRDPSATMFRRSNKTEHSNNLITQGVI